MVPVGAGQIGLPDARRLGLSARVAGSGPGPRSDPATPRSADRSSLGVPRRPGFPAAASATPAGRHVVGASTPRSRAGTVSPTAGLRARTKTLLAIRAWRSAGRLDRSKARRSSVKSG